METSVPNKKLGNTFFNDFEGQLECSSMAILFKISHFITTIFWNSRLLKISLKKRNLILRRFSSNRRSTQMTAFIVNKVVVMHK